MTVLLALAVAWQLGARVLTWVVPAAACPASWLSCHSASGRDLRRRTKRPLHSPSEEQVDGPGVTDYVERPVHGWSRAVDSEMGSSAPGKEENLMAS